MTSSLDVPHNRVIKVIYIYIYYTVILYSKGKDQPGKDVNPARGQLNRENVFPHSRPRIWSRETDSAVPSRVSLLIAILRLRLNPVRTYEISPEFSGGVYLFI